LLDAGLLEMRREAGPPKADYESLLPFVDALETWLLVGSRNLPRRGDPPKAVITMIILVFKEKIFDSVRRMWPRIKSCAAGSFPLQPETR
jgi:hypothetical protein